MPIACMEGKIVFLRDFVKLSRISSFPCPLIRRPFRREISEELTLKIQDFKICRQIGIEARLLEKSFVGLALKKHATDASCTID